MIIFDKKYYDDIWETVHRHDYCETKANELISKYGKCRILDLGCGCGFLVKTLRDKGCDAYGMDISEYAVENSHGNVVLGSVTDIPFKDNSFDVVFSQGLWEYVPEDQVDHAFSECKRVGKYQYHNLDAAEQNILLEYHFANIKPRVWWNEKKIGIGFDVIQKVLVATPTTLHKGYSMGRWLNNVKSFSYPNFDILVVDGSPNTSLYDEWKDKVLMQHIDTTGYEQLHELQKNQCFEACRKAFLKGDYDRLLIVESDIIPPKNIIEFLFEWGRDIDWISHSFPNRENQTTFEQGLGIGMFTRRFMEKYDWESLGDNYTSDGGLWIKCKDDFEYTIIEIYNKIKVGHLKE